LNDTIRQNYPAIVVFPQCPTDDSFWANVKIDQNLITRKTVFNFQEGGEPTCAMNLLLGLVDQMLDKPFISKKQVYIGGLSMGGMGTLEMLRRKPNTFAAAFLSAVAITPTTPKSMLRKCLYGSSTAQKTAWCRLIIRR
jgi:predicted peptidase